MMFQELPENWYQLVSGREDIVLLESTLPGGQHRRSFLFVDPVQILRMEWGGEVGNLFASVTRYLEQGYYLAGYFAYEYGSLLASLKRRADSRMHQPLVWLGVYREPWIYDHMSGLWQNGPDMERASRFEPEALAHRVSDIHFAVDVTAYSDIVQRIQEYIRAGDVYQLNFTDRYRFQFEGSPLSLYMMLKHKQRVGYSAYIRAAGQDILCFSPELFFSQTGPHIVTRPMKGTARRGRTGREDEEVVQWLSKDQKNRAENVMIVDLLRNDLGRVCQIGSVNVPQLFTIERYETLFQMTSTVEGRLRTDVNYEQVFRSLFPCGSVTGAPKLRAQELIQQLEAGPRGVYTGAIGYFAPPLMSRAMFNVAIRTIVLENGHGELGVGSGITSDSLAHDEYAECMLKAHFLTHPMADFAILEAILWEDGYRYLEQHLQRMKETAEYFGYRYNQAKIRAVLAQLSTHLIAGERYKVRISLNRRGDLTHEALPLTKSISVEIPTVVLSAERTNSQQRMYRHKTTQRALYDRASRFAQENGYAEVIFMNERGEITEGATHNVFIERSGLLLTPPVSCGLLGGIYRQRLLQEHPRAREELLYVEDLLGAEKIYICNAIRGLRHVQLAALSVRF